MVIKEGKPLLHLESLGELFAFVLGILGTRPCSGGSFLPGEAGSHPAGHLGFWDLHTLLSHFHYPEKGAIYHLVA